MFDVVNQSIKHVKSSDDHDGNVSMMQHQTHMLSQRMYILPIQGALL